jgi:hypothetical protein
MVVAVGWVSDDGDNLNDDGNVMLELAVECVKRDVSSVQQGKGWSMYLLVILCHHTSSQLACRQRRHATHELTSTRCPRRRNVGVNRGWPRVDGDGGLIVVGRRSELPMLG